MSRIGLVWRLAWRNVARNPRRSGLSIAATVFAVFLVVVFVAMAAGTHEKMIEDSVRIHSGHVQISGAGYLENQTLEHFVQLDDDLVGLLDSLEDIEGWAPRVVGFALTSKAESSHGTAVLGVDPAREGRVSTLRDRVLRGRFVSHANRSREIVLGERLARSLGAGVGDSVLVYGVAYSLETAYELFEVVGTLRLPEPDLERTLAVISLRHAQDFFVYGERVSEIAVLAGEADRSEALRSRLQSALAERTGDDFALEVHTWDEVMPELEQFIFLDDAGMFMLLALLIVVVGFGILNTILMAVLERTRELGVMLALGLKPVAVFRVVFLESMTMAAVGLAIGLALALPTVLYFQAHPIVLTGELGNMTELVGMEPVVTFKLKPLNPLGSSIAVFGVGFLAALYPALKASRGRPVDALRSL